MPAQEFFARALARFALQQSKAKRTAERQADAERLLGRAEYELHQVRRELLAALDVPLRDRAVKAAQIKEPEPADDAPAVSTSKAA